jgi:hypothetical protein
LSHLLCSNRAMEAIETSGERRVFARAVVDPQNWYPLEMSLENRPSPGFPHDYVIACRRTEESGISNSEAYAPYGHDTRLGAWDQRISYEVFRKIIVSLDSARILAFPVAQERPYFCSGPAGRSFVLEYRDRTYRWSNYGATTGWESLEASVEIMLAAVMYPGYVEQARPYFSLRRHMEAKKARHLLESAEGKDD